MRYNRFLAIAIVGMVAIGASLMTKPDMGLVDGIFYDLSLAAISQRPGASSESVAVIVLDSDSLASEELAEMPRVLLSPIWAKLLDALSDSDARAIGFDLIFSYSANHLPGLARQYDRNFLLSLARARQKVVLARSARSHPAESYYTAVYDPITDATSDEPAAIAYAELTPDTDGVYRRISATVAGEGVSYRSLAAALFTRSVNGVIPSGRLMLAPPVPLEAMPAYRLIDVLRCLDADPAGVHQLFAGKIVLIGGNLPEEDRKRTPDRFMRPPTPRRDTAGSCHLERLGASDPDSGTTPGVFVHAAAVQALVSHSFIRPISPVIQAGLTALMGIVGALLGFTLSPVVAALAFIAIAASAFAAAMVLVGVGWWLALAVPIGTAAGSSVFAYLIRLVLEERKRRWIQSAFRHYVAEDVMDQLVAQPGRLQLGGETRMLTLMFSDIRGFTTIAEGFKTNPQGLSRLINRGFLGPMSKMIMARNGTIDKYMGDCIMAFWNAPLDEIRHADLACESALAMVQELDSVNRQLEAEALAENRRFHPIQIGVGINTGECVVGNMGSDERFAYTAMGDAVNLASRLEGQSKTYYVAIVIGEATRLAAPSWAALELDLIVVKGQENVVRIYTLLGDASVARSAEFKALDEPHREMLALYRNQDWEGARAALIHCRSKCDTKLEGFYHLYEERIDYYAVNPPGAEWKGVFVADTK